MSLSQRDYERRDLLGGHYAIRENDADSMGGWWLYDQHRDLVCWCPMEDIEDAKARIAARQETRK